MNVAIPLNATTKASERDLRALPSHQKAEIVRGEIVPMSPTGARPNRAGFNIAMALRKYERTTGRGMAVADNAAFLVDLPDRGSFSPDAAYFTGKDPGMRFFEGAPIFAVEVRSEGDYGPSAEREMAVKRAEYFAAGTVVVWDVDLLDEDVVRIYRATEPLTPRAYRRGEIAEAEPALPGFRMPVDELFE